MKAPLFRTLGPMAPRFLANFDSASTMVRKLAFYLHDRPAPGLGGAAPSSEGLARVIHMLPDQVRERLYVYFGAAEGIPRKKVPNIRADELARWVSELYPSRSYPAVMIGSSSGAIVHLAAALGIPWLPQTFLIPVRHPAASPDDPWKDLEESREAGHALLEANPDIQLHHMHDPNQDRLMIERMSYFRIKRRTLGPSYERFLAERLQPGGTIYIVECNRSWPTTRIDDRYVFQFGALGGATPEEFHHGGPRVAAYLERYGAPRRAWEPPVPDTTSPEAEWGFEPALGADIERFARAHGFELRRVVFDEPEHPSPLVADLYRWWYGTRQLSPRRLLVSSFILMDPWWTLRTGSTPFWMKFNMEPSAEWLEQYLDGGTGWDDLYLMLFSHGVECVGLPPLERWRRILARAEKTGRFIGVDEALYPKHFGTYASYAKELERIPARYGMPGPLTEAQLASFLLERGDRYPVHFARAFEAPQSGARSERLRL